MKNVNCQRKGFEDGDYIIFGLIVSWGNVPNRTSLKVFQSITGTEKETGKGGGWWSYNQGCLTVYCVLALTVPSLLPRRSWCSRSAVRGETEGSRCSTTSLLQWTQKISALSSTPWRTPSCRKTSKISCCSDRHAADDGFSYCKLWNQPWIRAGEGLSAF